MATVRRAQQLGITYGAYGALGQSNSMDVIHDPVVVDIAERRGISAAQVALRFVTQQGLTAITASYNRTHMVDALRSFDIAPLSDDEMRQLAAVPYKMLMEAWTPEP
jgi:diketogulonate reductase-like aldo/keto reductase